MILYAPKSDQAIEIIIPENIKTIGMKVSGGTDSAILLYILCDYIYKNNLDIKILPITDVYLSRPISSEGALRVTHKIKELFNYQLNFLLDNHIYYRGRKIEKFMLWHDVKMLEEGVVDMIITGRTATPPKEAGEELWNTRPADRTGSDKSVHVPIIPNFPQWTFYRPMNNVDKKFVAEMYDLYGVRESLFPTTMSCIADFPNNKGWSQPCGYCHWCLEKQWAFGEMDTPRRTYIEDISDEVYDWQPQHISISGF